MERQQKIRKTAMRKVALNWTNSGVPIENGINILGAARLCSCGNELLPYQDSCPSCGK